MKKNQNVILSILTTLCFLIGNVNASEIELMDSEGSVSFENSSNSESLILIDAEVYAEDDILNITNKIARGIRECAEGSSDKLDTYIRHYGGNPHVYITGDLFKNKTLKALLKEKKDKCPSPKKLFCNIFCKKKSRKLTCLNDYQKNALDSFFVNFASLNLNGHLIEKTDFLTDIAFKNYFPLIENWSPSDGLVNQIDEIATRQLERMRRFVNI